MQTQYDVTNKLGSAKSMQCLRSRGRLNNLIGTYISVSVCQGRQVTKHERFSTSCLMNSNDDEWGHAMQHEFVSSSVYCVVTICTTYRIIRKLYNSPKVFFYWFHIVRTIKSEHCPKEH
jgi:hypothetical protein